MGIQVKMFTVIVHKPRPDFRVFIDLLFGAGRNVDADGDADPVSSREWLELYITDRESNAPNVELQAEACDPTLFEVRSESAQLAELAALYLYLYCGEVLKRDGVAVGPDECAHLKASYADQLARAERAVWHWSSVDDPFPDLGVVDECMKARKVLQSYQPISRDRSILRMALEGLIEIEDGVLENSAAEKAARHVEACSLCAEWLDEFYPDRAERRKAIEARASTYCCPSLRHAIYDADAQTRISFTMFRGEDPCWQINDDLCFAKYCPWCGSALPDEPAEMEL